MPPAKRLGQKLLSNGTCLCAGLDNYFTAYCLTGCWEGGEGKRGGRGKQSGQRDPLVTPDGGEKGPVWGRADPTRSGEGCGGGGARYEAGERMSSLLDLLLSEL